MGKAIFEYVTKRWGDIVAVRDLCIEIHDKEFVVFVGPSGCGKTITLRIQVMLVMHLA